MIDQYIERLIDCINEGGRGLIVVIAVVDVLEGYSPVVRLPGHYGRRNETTQMNVPFRAVEDRAVRWEELLLAGHATME